MKANRYPYSNTDSDRSLLIFVQYFQIQSKLEFCVIQCVTKRVLQLRSDDPIWRGTFLAVLLEMVETSIVSWSTGRLLHSDAILFHEGRWLNDMCILYYFDVILNEKYSKHSGWDQVLLLDPCTAFAIRFEEDEDDLAQLIDGLKLAQRRCLIVPINDSDDPTLPCGGSHWSLLVLSRTAPLKPWAGVYYDSAPGREMPGWVNSVGRKLTGVGDIKTTVGECSKQTNCSDCGMYVLEFAERVLRMFLDDDEMSLLDITTNLISALRRSVLASIRKNDRVFL